MLWRLLLWLFGVRGSSRRPPRREARPGRPIPVRVVSVQDGDSLLVIPLKAGDRERFRVRLYAIDAPEGDQQYGQEARDYLWRLVWNRNDLMLEAMDTDRYGRLVGVLYYRAMDRRRSINRLMVEQGLALWYGRYGGHGLGLERAEHDARRRRRGLWSSSHSLPPWEHRRAQRRAAEQRGQLRWLLVAALAGCLGVAVWLALRLMERLG